MARTVSAAIAQYNWEVLTEKRRKETSKTVFLLLLRILVPHCLECWVAGHAQTVETSLSLWDSVPRCVIKNYMGKLVSNHTRVAIRPRRVNGSGGQIVA